MYDAEWIYGIYRRISLLWKHKLYRLHCRSASDYSIYISLIILVSLLIFATFISNTILFNFNNKPR